MLKSFLVFFGQFHDSKESCVDFLVFGKLFVKFVVLIFRAKHAKVLFTVSEDNLKNLINVVS